MTGHKRTTTQRGLGRQHQLQRKRLLRTALGTWCPLRLPGCDGLMINPSRMDLDHTIPRALGGTTGDRIVCSHCNRSAGATLGNQMRQQVRAYVRSRQW
jgi:5-methylcytosine-specific restriction endonuclease McrA